MGSRHDDIRTLAELAIHAGLGGSKIRRLLMFGVSTRVVSSIPEQDSPQGQMLQDLVVLSSVWGDLHEWFENALFLIPSDDVRDQLRTIKVSLSISEREVPMPPRFSAHERVGEAE